MMLKRKISVFLAASMLLSSLAGCSDNAKPQSSAEESTGTTSSSEAAASEDDTGYTLPLSTTNETINCWGFPLPDWKVDNLEDNQFTQWLKEQTGVDLTFTMGPSTDRETKLSLLMSSGEYPEILFNPGFTPSQQQLYGSQGIILELNDYIDKYGVETKRMFDEVPDIKAAVERNEGKIYCLPSFFDTPHDYSYSRLWVYQPWLDALDMQLPTTTEEFYDMLVAFRDQDPNGNGKKDEIPYAGADVVMFSDPVTYFMNSFIYYDNNTMMNVVDGKIIPTYIQEEYKQGLQYLNRLYNDGLLMPQTFSQNDQALKQLLANDPPIIGCFTAHAPFVYADEEYYSQLTPLAPLKGPEGVQYTAQYYTTQTDGTVITNTCKNPELAFKLLDFLYSLEASTRKSQGPEGVAWEFNTDKELVNEYGLNPTWLVLQSSDEITPNDRWSMLGNGYQPNNYNGLYSMDMSPDAVEARKNNDGKVDGYVQIQLAAMEVYNNYFPPEELRMPQVMLFTEDESLTLADMELALKNKILESRTGFITGNLNFESDWEDYINSLEQLGMSQVVELYQTAYDRRG